VIDLHAHILPGLDHGARDWDEAMMLCQMALDDGITTIAATPHVSEAFPNSRTKILAVRREMLQRLADAGIGIRVAEGGDYHVHPDLGHAKVLTLGGNGRYFLLEFPYYVLPPRSEVFVESLIAKGLTPVITHPERITSLHGREEKLEPLLEKGALVQVTAGSVSGNFGPACRASAVRMLKEGWVHILASDAHWVDERQPILSEGMTEAARIIGSTAARALVEDNPKKILAGEDLNK